jgi:nucleoside phosphorylase
VVLGAATRWEIQTLLDALGPVRRLRRAPVPAWIRQLGTTRLVVYKTGIGVEQAADTTDKIFAHIHARPVLLVNTGCAGGLAPGLEPGAIVIPDDVVSLTTGQQCRYRVDPGWAARMRAICRELQIAADPGPLFTSLTPLTSPSAKQAVLTTHAATAVDMESAAVARVGDHHGVPTVIVRAVLDGAEETAPCTNAVDTTPLNRVFYVAYPLCHQTTPAKFLGFERQLEKVRLVLSAFFRRLVADREWFENQHKDCDNTQS